MKTKLMAMAVTVGVACVPLAANADINAPVSKDITVRATIPHTVKITKSSGEELDGHVAKIENDGNRLKGAMVPIQVHSNGLVGMKITADPDPKLTHQNEATRNMPLKVSIEGSDLTTQAGHEVNADQFQSGDTLKPKDLTLEIAPTETDLMKHAAGDYKGTVKVHVSPSAAAIQ